MLLHCLVRPKIFNALPQLDNNVTLLYSIPLVNWRSLEYNVERWRGCKFSEFLSMFGNIQLSFMDIKKVYTGIVLPSSYFQSLSFTSPVILMKWHKLSGRTDTPLDVLCVSRQMADIIHTVVKSLACVPSFSQWQSQAHKAGCVDTYLSILWIFCQLLSG